MRMSGLFSQTLREAPADAEVQSHIFLMRAGFIRQLASGIFSYLPLARRALTKIEGLIRSEIDDIGGQEIRRALDSLERTSNTSSQGAGKNRLGHSGNIFQ